MKLLIITSIKAFEKDIKGILKKAEVSSYTYKDVIGYRDASELSIKENWFANDMNEGEALFFYAFLKKENTDLVFDMVNEFNKNQESLSSIHVAVINIEIRPIEGIFFMTSALLINHSSQVCIMHDLS